MSERLSSDVAAVAAGSPVVAPALARDAEAFRQLGYRAVDLAADFLAGMRERPVFAPMAPEARRALLEQPLPVRGVEPDAILDQFSSMVLPWLEAALAFALLVPASRHLAALGAAALLAGYALAIGINLWRGRRDIDCGCAGPEQAQPIRPVLLARNAALVGLALVASLAPLGRDLGVFDSFVVIAASTVALLLYVGAI